MPLQIVPWRPWGHFIETTTEIVAKVLIAKRHMDNCWGPVDVSLLKPSGYMALYNIFYGTYIFYNKKIGFLKYDFRTDIGTTEVIEISEKPIQNNYFFTT